MVELSLLDVELASLVNVVHNQLIAGEPPRRLGNAHPTIVPYDVFATADSHLALAVATEDQWMRLCRAIGRPELATDDRFATNGRRVAEREALMEIVEPILVGRRTADWVTDLRAADIPCGPVNTVGEILADPAVVDSGILIELDRPEGAVRVVGSPLRFAAGPLPAAPPPRLGQDSRTILREAGLDDEAIERLIAAGVVSAEPPRADDLAT
jgi:crotonobetainyl-CoA:carnitine CoA-transferase CaiB-like acyl-CoA transferase